MINSQSFFNFVSDNNKFIKKGEYTALGNIIFSGVYMSIEPCGTHILTVMSHNFTGKIKSKL